MRKNYINLTSVVTTENSISFIARDGVDKSTSKWLILRTDKPSVAIYLNAELIKEFEGKIYPKKALCSIPGYITYFDVYTYIRNFVTLAVKENNDRFASMVAKLLKVNFNDEKPIVKNTIRFGGFELSKFRTCTVTIKETGKTVRCVKAFVEDTTSKYAKYFEKEVFISSKALIIYYDHNKYSVKEDEYFDYELYSSIYYTSVEKSLKEIEKNAIGYPIQSHMNRSAIIDSMR